MVFLEGESVMFRGVLPVLGASFLAVASMPEPVAAGAPASDAAASPRAAAQTPLSRRYREGEVVFYRMTASNRDRFRTTTYRADATGTVKKGPSGSFVEEFTWSNFVFDDKPVELPAAKDFRQLLSLTPGYPMSMPDIRPVLRIVGPIADLLTFYVDVALATQQGSLAKEGDHFRFDHGTPASWADGSYVVVGEDSIDFDITLKELNVIDRVATLLVRHVVPTEPKVRIPVEWMRAPVADTPNNWVEVQKLQDGTYRAQVGKELFDATIRISLVDGRILGATLVNPVEVSERICTDDALTKCRQPVSSQILRQIEISTER
jgi:hypothetical protein